MLALQPPLEDPKAFLAQAEQYARLGVTELQTMPDGDPAAFAERVGRDLVVPHLASIG